MALREGRERKILSPAAKRRAVDMLKQTLGMSERLECKAVGALGDRQTAIIERLPEGGTATGVAKRIERLQEKRPRPSRS